MQNLRKTYASTSMHVTKKEKEEYYKNVQRECKIES